jgi:hypothetical protein
MLYVSLYSLWAWCIIYYGRRTQVRQFAWFGAILGLIAIAVIFSLIMLIMSLSWQGLSFWDIALGGISLFFLLCYGLWYWSRASGWLYVLRGYLRLWSMGLFGLGVMYIVFGAISV